MDFSRRDWILATAALWPEIVAAQKMGPAAFQYLDRQTAAEIAALTEQIIPSDDTPGAREAGVIYFIDRALTTFAKDQREAYRAGMLEMQAKRTALFPDSQSIALLTEPRQIELLQSMEGSNFFQLLRFHTLAGFLGNPSYGGNRDRVGWKVIGFDHQMAYQPPFGYYDREANANKGPR